MNFSDRIIEAKTNLRPPPRPSLEVLEKLPQNYYNNPLLNKFLGYFETCPICYKQNHKSHLLNFYFSENHEEIKLMRQLKNVIKYMEEGVKNIKFGIPCCSCFNKLFEKVHSPISLRGAIMAELQALFGSRRRSE